MSNQTPNRKTPSSNINKSPKSGSEVKKAAASNKAAPGKKPVSASERKPVSASERKPVSAGAQKALPVIKKESKLISGIKNYYFRLRKQKYKYGTVATILTAAVIACVILLNVLVGAFTETYGIKFDMTSDKRFAVTSDTKDVLKDLNEKVNIDVYMSETDFRSQTYGNEMAEILNKYEVYGGNNVTVTYVDPLRNPTYADKYKSAVTIDKGTVVVQKGDNYKAIPMIDLYYWYDASKENAVGTSIERELTTTILNLGLTQADKPTAAILYGHGELNLDTLAIQLSANSYNVILLNLLTDSIPDDVSLMVMNCPSTDYTEDEIPKIEKYLGNHHNLIFFYGAEVPKLTNLELFYKEWGATFESSMVCDSTYRVLGQYGNIVSVPTDTTDPLVAGLNTNQYVVMPFSREMHVKPIESNLITVTDLLNTSSVAYSKSLAGGTLTSYEKADGDTTGPFSTAILTTKSTIVNNLYVYTNVLFISSPYLYDDNLLSTESYGNQRFFTNILAKFNPTNETVSISGKKYTDPELNIVGNELSVMLVVLCLVPAAALVSGLVVWHRRKNR